VASEGSTAALVAIWREAEREKKRESRGQIDCLTPDLCTVKRQTLDCGYTNTTATRIKKAKRILYVLPNLLKLLDSAQHYTEIIYQSKKYTCQQAVNSKRKSKILRKKMFVTL
jgi:hypothetical protein